MSKLSQLNTIKDLYAKGGNIIEFLRKDTNGNDPEAIMISYDFQAGSYIRAAKNNPAFLDNYTDAVSTMLSSLGEADTIMEVGIGEATLMTPLMRKYDPNDKVRKMGFDISWSRVKYAREHSTANDVHIELFTADLFNIPLPDSSVDIVYTSHSLEPNGGREKDAIAELFRVAKKYVVLLEPAYEFAGEEGKQRMEKHGYVKYLYKHAAELGLEVIRHEPFAHSSNPLNPTGLTIIRKEAVGTHCRFQCPVTKTDLNPVKGSLYSDEGLLVYPVIDGIPCLQADNAILAAHFNS